MNKASLELSISDENDYYNIIKDGFPGIAEALKNAVDKDQDVYSSSDASQPDVDEAKKTLDRPFRRQRQTKPRQIRMRQTQKQRMQ